MEVIKEYKSECEKYEIWREFLGKKFEKRRKFFNDLLMPDNVLEIIKNLSLGSIIETMKPSSSQDSKEITVDDLISLYSLEKNLGKNNGNGVYRAKGMRNSMEKYFNEDLELLGFNVSDNKLKVENPKNIKNVNEIKKLKRNIPKFTNEFTGYINSLENDYILHKGEMQIKIEDYNKKINKLEKLQNKYDRFSRKKRFEKKIKKYVKVKENLWREMAIYEFVIGTARRSIKKHKEDMLTNINGLIDVLENKSDNFPGYA
ncbi:MAG: hypothetical protein KAT37_02365 [Candidatus Aenigmarchaeota archaeon]|nr:hypothetical protein [Candidatus Aenigmarchaeota archaeon]